MWFGGNEVVYRLLESGNCVEVVNFLVVGRNRREDLPPVTTLERIPRICWIRRGIGNPKGRKHICEFVFDIQVWHDARLALPCARDCPEQYKELVRRSMAVVLFGLYIE